MPNKILSLQNELRKAKKLEELMEELSLVPCGETLEVG